MKKLLLLTITLLISLSALAQDIAKYRSMTKDETLNFSKNIASEVRGDYQIFIDKEYKDYQVITFIPTNVSDENLAKIKKVGLGSSGVIFFDVTFEKFYEGRDLDMEIEGVKKYRFKDVTLKFLDAIKVWNKYFNKEATIEGVKNYENKERRIRNKDIHWLYKFKKEQSPYWSIIKFY